MIYILPLFYLTKNLFFILGSLSALENIFKENETFYPFYMYIG